MSKINRIIHLVAIMYLSFDYNFGDLGKFSEVYSGKITENKIKHAFGSKKVYYQNPSVRSHVGYHNKTIPIGCRESKKSIYGAELKARAKRENIPKGLEKRL